MPFIGSAIVVRGNSFVNVAHHSPHWTTTCNRALAFVSALFITSNLFVHSVKADPFNGRLLFSRCGICHNIGKSGPVKQGPTLAGLFGRKAGSIAGFRYSKAMRKSDIVWNSETLDKFLTKPKKYLPGTSMIYSGLQKPNDRRDLIQYLRQALSSPQ
jgi:cytochrome c